MARKGKVERLKPDRKTRRKIEKILRRDRRRRKPK
jgi:hypothetical protein